MSDDKSKDPKDQGQGNGTGSDPGNPDNATKMGFGELLGHIDSRIEAALGKVTGGSKKPESVDPQSADPQSVAEQVRQELAKLNGEKEAADKDAAREVTIKELQEQVTKLSESKPVENVSKLTQIMWGKKPKS